MTKIEEIFKSWCIAFNPNSEQSELAIKRIEICDSCEFKSIRELGVVTVASCSVCGCALSGKIYTPKLFSDEGGSCPKEKWMIVEKEWVDKKNK